MGGAGLSRESPEEIRRREVELDSQERAQKRSGGGWWSWTLRKEPRRDEEQGVELDSQETAQKRSGGGGGAGLSRDSPEEIRRREVELDSQERAQKISGGGRWSWTLKREPRRYQEEGGRAGLSRESPTEFKSKEVELGSHSWMVCLAAELFLNSYLSDAVFVTLLRTACWNSSYRSTEAASHWRGPHLLNIVVLAEADRL